MNTPVKLELAKLLKEKNIVVKSDKKYNHFLNKEGEEITDQFIYDFYNGHVPSTINIAKSIFAMYTIPAPTIAEVVMWLYETHKIWINVYQHKDWAADVNDEYVFRTNYTRIKDYKSPTEAYEAAIEHNLNKLI